MSDKTEQPETKVLNLDDLVPKPKPEIFTLLGAIEAGVKSVREALEGKTPNQPNALMRATTVKAAIVSIEAMLQLQVTDTIMKVQAFSLAGQLSNLLGKDDKTKTDDANVNVVGEGSGYL